MRSTSSADSLACLAQQEPALFGVVFPQAGGLIDVRDDAPVFDESRDFIINASNDSPLNPGLIISDVRFSDNRLRVFTAYLGGVVGMALRINDEVSVAAAIKPVYSFGDVLLSGSIELFNEEFGWFDLPELQDATIITESTGWDVGGIFGLHYQPDETLRASLKFETLTRITLFNEAIEDPAGITEGQDEIQTDIPAMLNLGVAKTFSNALELRLDVNYFYNEYADAGTILGVNINGQRKNTGKLLWGPAIQSTNRSPLGVEPPSLKQDLPMKFGAQIATAWTRLPWVPGRATRSPRKVSASLMAQFFEDGKTAVTPATSQTPSGQTTLKTTFYVFQTDLSWRFD